MLRACVLALLLAAPLAAQEVQLPAEVRGIEGQPIQVLPTKVDGGTPEWYLGTGLSTLDLSKLIALEWPDGVPEAQRPSLKLKGVVVYGKSGTYEVWSWNAKGSKASKLAITRVVIEGLGPPPPPPPPPGPTPPNPTDAFIPAPGLHVLFVENSKKRASIPRSRLNQLWDAEIVAELNAKCSKDGAMPGWLMLDAGDDVSVLAPHWQTAVKRARSDDFWMIVSNPGKGSWEGPLPATKADTLTILRKFE